MEQINATKLLSVRASRLSLNVLASDGKQYFVKLGSFGSCLATKAFAARITRHCGVQTAAPAIVIFDQEFAAHARAVCGCEEMRPSITAGSHLGSQYPADPERTLIFDCFPPNLADRIQNAGDLARMRAVDCWVANPTPGQAVFVQQADKTYRTYAVGMGGSFWFPSWSPKRSWNWALSPLRATEVWTAATDMADRVGRLTRRELESLAVGIPPSWWKGSPGTAEEIVNALIARKEILGSLLRQCRRAEFDLPDRRVVRVERSNAAAVRSAG